LAAAAAYSAAAYSAATAVKAVFFSSKTFIITCSNDKETNELLFTVNSIKKWSKEAHDRTSEQPRLFIIEQ